MNLRKSILATLLLGAALTTTGCFWLAAGAVAGAAGATYKLGKLEANLDSSLPTVHKASVAALEALQIPVTASPLDSLTGKVEGTTAQSKPVVINMKRVTDTTTTIDIRIQTGMMGDDKTQAQAIYDEIKKRLI